MRNNLFCDDIGAFIVPSLGNNIYFYETLLLDGNRFYGELNYRIFNFLVNLRTLGLRNNHLTRLGELTNSLRWNWLELSGNPLNGSIPESYRRFSKLEYLGLDGTLLNRGESNFLPDFMDYAVPFSLEDESRFYVCPSIISNLGLIELNVRMNPKYYDYELCKCLPGYFGFGENCVQCPRECECTDGTNLKYCYASPTVFRLKSILVCPRPDSCHTFIPSKVSNNNTSIPISKVCEEGYEGHACSKCQDGYGSQGRSCIKCEQEAVYSTLILGSLGFLLFITYLYFKETSTSGLF